MNTAPAGESTSTSTSTSDRTAPVVVVAHDDPATARTAATSTAAAADNVPPVLRPAGQKLRDCCQSCARSKVRCTKEKPSCSRCDTKGIPCRYLQSKRPGRIPGSGARRLNQANSSNDGPRNPPGADAGSLAKHHHHHNNNNNNNNNNNINTPAAAASAAPGQNNGSDAADDRSTTAPSLLSPLGGFLLDGGHTRADSLFDPYYGVSEAVGSHGSPTMDFDGDHSVPFVWDDCFDVLATMDDPLYANLMDWDSTASALSMTLPLDTETGTAGRSNCVSDCGNVAQSPASRLLPSATHMQSSTTTQANGIAHAPAQAAAPSTLSTLTSLTSSSCSSSAVLSRDSHAPTRDTSPAGPSNGPATIDLLTLTHPKPTNTASSCHCLDTALDLLKDVNKDPGSDLSHAPGSPETQVILAKNKETIQATITILACVSCREDRLLLMVALLIAMKVLPRYACAAALTSSATDHSSQPVGSSIGHHRSSSELVTKVDILRQAKQQVLRELHLVQRLITQLSSRLKGLSSPEQEEIRTANLLTHRPAMPVRSDSAISQKTRPSSSRTPSSTEFLPISTRALDLVGDDVRNSLSSLSAVVRNALKDS